MKNIVRCFLVAWAVVFSGFVVSAQPLRLFYMDDSEAASQSFEAHAAKIDLLVPTWYQVDGDGLLSGGAKPEVMRLAQQRKVGVMPIVSLFDTDVFRDLASSPIAQTRMNDAMIRECKAHGYTGFQIDFEHIYWTDRDLLTDLVARSAAALHSAGFQLSVAVVPNAPGYVTAKDGFEAWIFREWRGAYDLAALGKSADMICLMTYDQHTRWTMPGPVAGWQWTNENVKYALKVVPKDKLLLGIPLYGYRWYADSPEQSQDGESPQLTADEISAPHALQLAASYRAGKVEWDAEDHTPYFYFYRQQMREWVYFTDAKAFQERAGLVNQYGLKGFCAWVLGSEDPKIWQTLPDRAQ